MDMGKSLANRTVAFNKIESTIGDFTAKPTTLFPEHGRDFFITKMLLTLSMPNKTLAKRSFEGPRQFLKSVLPDMPICG